MKKALSIISAVICAFGLTSCVCEDIGWTPPKPVSQLQGLVLVSDKIGVEPSPKPNAFIEVEINGNNYTATTDANGHYLIEEIEAGDAVAGVTVEDADLHGYSRHVTIEEGAIATCNFILAKVSTNVTHEKKGHDDVYTITLPDIIQEDKEAIQIATYYIPEGTLRDGEELDLQAWYELRPNIYGTRATDIPLIDDEGFHYTGDNVDITVLAKSTYNNEEALQLFNIDVKDLMDPICVVHKGVEVTTVRDPAKNISSFKTKQIGKTVLTYPIYKKEIGEGYEDLEFDPAEYTSTGGWTKIYSKYFMKYAEYNWAIQVPSIIWQYAVLMTGYFSAGEYQYYSTRVNLPKGETIILDGWQHYALTRYKCGWAYVDCKLYDQIFIEYKDRKHTGGSN